MWEKSNVFMVISKVSKINDMVTSYEIVCAILRIAPSRAYLELEDQPAARVV